MKQCYNYNPNEHFSFTNEQQKQQINENTSDTSSSSEIEKIKSKKRKNSKKKKNINNLYLTQPQLSNQHFIPTIPLNYNSSSMKSLQSSDSDSESENIKKKKHRKITKSKINNDNLFSNSQIAFMPQFNQNVPFGFPTSNLPFNPMMAFKQMMGYNPTMNFTKNSDKEKL